jgi:hypothetical protein
MISDPYDNALPVFDEELVIWKDATHLWNSFMFLLEHGPYRGFKDFQIKWIFLADNHQCSWTSLEEFLAAPKLNLSLLFWFDIYFQVNHFIVSNPDGSFLTTKCKPFWLSNKQQGTIYLASLFQEAAQNQNALVLQLPITRFMRHELYERQLIYVIKHLL